MGPTGPQMGPFGLNLGPNEAESTPGPFGGPPWPQKDHIGTKNPKVAKSGTCHRFCQTLGRRLLQAGQLVDKLSFILSAADYSHLQGPMEGSLGGLYWKAILEGLIGGPSIREPCWRAPWESPMRGPSHRAFPWAPLRRQW